MSREPRQSGLLDAFDAFGELDICTLVKVGEVELPERLACFLGESETSCFLADCCSF